MQLQTAEALFKHLCDALGVTGKTKRVNYEQMLRRFLSEKRKTTKTKTSSARGKKGGKTSWKENLEPNPLPQEGAMIVFLADEIDRLRTSDNHVLYSLFELCALPNSPFVLISIANALDMTDRILPRLLNSQYEPETLHFAPYTAEQMADIIKARLGDVGHVIEQDAIDFCAGKIAAQSADVRSALEVMR